LKAQLTFFILLFSTLIFGREYFESEKKHIDIEFQQKHAAYSKAIRTNQFSDSFYANLIKSIDEAESKENYFYYNHFNSMLIDYYFKEKDFKAVIDLYDKQLVKPKEKNSLAYIVLQINFYNFFYKYSIDEECTHIVQNLKKIVENLEGVEKIYAKSIVDEIDGLKIKKHTIDVKQANVVEGIKTIETLAKYFNKDKHDYLLSQKYNHLAITYLEDKNRISHAILLLKKSLRYNNNYNTNHRLILHSNLGYAYNQIGDYESAKHHLTIAIQLIEQTNDVYEAGYRVYCNLADSYDFQNNQIQFSKYKSICENHIAKYNANKELLQQQINSYIHSEERIQKQQSKFEYYPYLIGSILIIAALFYFYKSRKLSINLN